MAIGERLRAAWRALTLSDFKQLSIVTPPVTAGVTVSQATALNYSAFWNAVNILSSQTAVLPRVLYKRTDDDGRERATTHPAYKLLLMQPNVTMTPYVFWETFVAHILVWGNGYAEIEHDRRDAPIALWPILPNEIQPQMEDDKVSYLYRGTKRLESWQVLHVPGFGFDGIQGYSVVDKARQSIGVGIAQEQFAGGFYGNGAVPSVVLEHPGKLSPDAHNRLKTSWYREHGGPLKQQGVAVAEEGMKVNVIGMPHRDAQFLESRQFEVEEIARWFNLPPHKLKLKVGERPGGNLESSQIEFLTDSLYPWLVRIEQECNRKLLRMADRQSLYVEHLVNALLRPNAADRVQVQKAYFDMGVLDAETIAKMENLPPPKSKPEPEPVPAAAAPEPEPEPDEEQDRRLRAAIRAVLMDAMGRFCHREADRIARAAKKPEALQEWLGANRGSLVEELAGHLAPGVGLVLARRGAKGNPLEVCRRLAAEYVAASEEQILGLPARDLEQAAGRMVAAWRMTRPAAMADAILEGSS